MGDTLPTIRSMRTRNRYNHLGSNKPEVVEIYFDSLEIGKERARICD